MSVGKRMCAEGAQTISEITGESCTGEVKREMRISIDDYLKEVDEDRVCAAVSTHGGENGRGFFMLLIPEESRSHFSRKMAGIYSMDEDMGDEALQELANILSSRMLTLLSEDERSSLIHEPPMGSTDAVKSFRRILYGMAERGIRHIDLIDMDFILPEKKLSVHVLYRKDGTSKDKYGMS